jgi:hypothetical protein
LTDFKVKSVFYAEAFYGVHVQVKDFVSHYLLAYKAYLPPFMLKDPGVHIQRISSPSKLMKEEILS